MKVQIIKKGDRTFLRGWLFGFIPMGYDDGYDGGWTPFFNYTISEESARNRIATWKMQNEAERKFKESRAIILEETVI